jgi:hypothetical protein
MFVSASYHSLYCDDYRDARAEHPLRVSSQKARYTLDNNNKQMNKNVL